MDSGESEHADGGRSVSDGPRVAMLLLQAFYVGCDDHLHCAYRHHALLAAVVVPDPQSREQKVRQTGGRTDCPEGAVCSVPVVEPRVVDAQRGRIEELHERSNEPDVRPQSHQVNCARGHAAIHPAAGAHEALYHRSPWPKAAHIATYAAKALPF